MAMNDKTITPATVLSTLASALGTSTDELRLRGEEGDRRPDLIVDWGPYRLVVEVKRSASTGSIALATDQLAHYVAAGDGHLLPVLVVPFMGDTGKRICENKGISWIDLSGNANLTAPGLRVLIAGRPNQFRFPGRPSSVFAPKSARVVRWLLIHPDQWQGQREIARAIGMDPGYTNLTLGRLVNEGYLLKDDSGKVRVRDRALLLDAWRDASDFTRHRIIKGHVPARSGEEALGIIASILSNNGITHAATGLSGAWLIRHFANFRLTTVFVDEAPPEQLLKAIGFRPEPKGANVWLVVPRDEGVFQGATLREGIQCAHPVQIYTDLKAQPERADEASEDLRGAILSGAFDD
jgi:hypothetical protein